MIKTRLIGQVPSSKKYIALTVVAQWVKTVANIVMIFILSNLLALILDGKIFDFASLLPYLCVILGVMIVRYLCGYFASKTSFYASSEVKKVLRQKMYQKLTRMGASYHEKVSTSEVLQVFVEGVDQLELYFGKYLPQFFYAMLAPITLFAVLVFVSWKASLVRIIGISDTLSLSLETRAFTLDDSESSVYKVITIKARDFVFLFLVITLCVFGGVMIWA
jgi:ABC-type transport system involved in cytochrome bd biosynthesis fused ATPase/permease subunit